MKKRITLTGKQLDGHPEWEAYDHRSISNMHPIIGKPGTIVEETEEIAEGRFVRQRVLRIEGGKETVITEAVYPV